jgi:hypothetical protein
VSTRRSLSLVVVVALSVSTGTRGQSAVRPDLPDPRRAVVVVDDAGDVGLRISDAQMAHELVISRLRRRLGNDAVVYEGARKSAAEMKRMLGPSAETTVQDAQLQWFDAAAKAAAWRVRVRFGHKKGEHWLTVACRRAGDDARKPVDERRFSGRTFLAARDAADAGLDAFCPALPAAAMQLPLEGAAPSTSLPAPDVPLGFRKKPKASTPWTPPPRRD